MGEITQRPMRGRVLLVEDDDDLRPLLAEALEREHIEVRTMSNGAEATNYLGTMFQNPHLIPLPDLLITDLRMPFVDGFSVLREWPLPALMITSFGDPQTYERARSMGVRLLIKPFGLTDFRQAVADLLE